MFGSITDEEIAANAGKTYQDATALRDPLAGLGYEEPGGEVQGPFEANARDAWRWIIPASRARKTAVLPKGRCQGLTKGRPGSSAKRMGICVGLSNILDSEL